MKNRWMNGWKIDVRMENRWMNGWKDKKTERC